MTLRWSTSRQTTGLPSVWHLCSPNPPPLVSLAQRISHPTINFLALSSGCLQYVYCIRTLGSCVQRMLRGIVSFSPRFEFADISQKFNSCYNRHHNVLIYYFWCIILKMKYFWFLKHHFITRDSTCYSAYMLSPVRPSVRQMDGS